MFDGYVEILIDSEVIQPYGDVVDKIYPGVVWNDQGAITGNIGECEVGKDAAHVAEPEDTCGR